MVFTTPEQRLFSKIQLPVQKRAHRKRAEFHSLTLLCSALLCSALLCSLSMSAKAHIVKPFFTAGSPLLWQFQRKAALRSTGPMGRRLAAGWLPSGSPCRFASPPCGGSANGCLRPEYTSFRFRLQEPCRTSCAEFCTGFLAKVQKAPSVRAVLRLFRRFSSVQRSAAPAAEHRPVRQSCRCPPAQRSDPPSAPAGCGRGPSEFPRPPAHTGR